MGKGSEKVRTSSRLIGRSCEASATPRLGARVCLKSLLHPSRSSTNNVCGLQSRSPLSAIHGPTSTSPHNRPTWRIRHRWAEKSIFGGSRHLTRTSQDTFVYNGWTLPTSFDAESSQCRTSANSSSQLVPVSGSPKSAWALFT